MRVVHRVRVRALRTLSALALAYAAVGGVGTGCVVTKDPDFKQADVLAEGACMCAMCWDRPFCLNADGTTVAKTGSTCPAGAIASEQANRIVGLARTTETFHCIRPKDKEILGTGTQCPSDDAGRQRIAEVQKCLVHRM